MRLKGKPVINKPKIKQLSEREVITRGLICQYFCKIFPQRKDLESIILNWRFHKTEARQNDDYTAENLPFHLQDAEWMVKYVISVVENYQPKFKLKPEHVEDYILNSPAFATMRNYFENDLVKAEINHLHEVMDQKALFDKSKDKICHDIEDYDLYFRKQISSIMSIFAIDSKVSESNIEKNADLWREKVMLQTFENKYNPYEMTIMTRNNLWYKYYKKFKAAHRKVWMKNREYEYYLEHKDLIDELGLATKNMKISDRKAEAIQNQLDKFENKYCRLISGRVLKKSIFDFNFLGKKKKVEKVQSFNPNGVMLKRKDDNGKNL